MNLVVRTANASVNTATGGGATNTNATGAIATGASDTVAVPAEVANAIADPNGIVTGAQARLVALRRAALPAQVITTVMRSGPHGVTLATQGEVLPMGAAIMVIGAGAVGVLGAAGATATNIRTTGM